MAKKLYVSEALFLIGACPAAREWVQSRRGKRGGVKATWEALEDSDWMSWLVSECEMEPANKRFKKALYGEDGYFNIFWRHEAQICDVYRKHINFNRLLKKLEKLARKRQEEIKNDPYLLNFYTTRYPEYNHLFR